MAGVCAGTILHFLMSLHQYVWLTIKCRGWFLFRYQRSVGTAWVVILRGSALCAARQSADPTRKMALPNSGTGRFRRGLNCLSSSVWQVGFC